MEKDLYMKEFPDQEKLYNERCERLKLSRGLYKEDLLHLLEQAMYIPLNGIYVEIGVANGSSLMAVSSFRPDVHCFGIEENEGCKADKNIEQERIKNTQILWGKSEEICKTWDKEIDLLFIDGEHYMKNIFWDCLGWFPFVKQEGTIMFHDYEKPEEGKHEVGKAVQIFRNHPKYKCMIPSVDEIISTSMVILKKL